MSFRKLKVFDHKMYSEANLKSVSELNEDQK